MESDGEAEEAEAFAPMKAVYKAKDVDYARACGEPG